MATCTVTVNYRSPLGDHVDIANFQVSALAVYLNNPILTPDVINFNVVDGGTFDLQQGDKLRIRVTTWDTEWSVEVPAQTAINLDELALNHSINPTSGLPVPIVPDSMQDLVTQAVSARDVASSSATAAADSATTAVAAKADVEAVVATNDGIMATVLANPASAASTVLSATFARLGGNGIAFLGDSITASGDGQNSPGSEWASQICMNSKGRLRWVRNAGIGGNTTEQMFARIQTDVIAFAPDYCIVLGGANDASAEVARGNLPLIYSALRAAGITPIAATIPPKNGDPGGKAAELNAWIISNAEQSGMQVINFYSVLVDSVTGEYISGLTSDGTHPTALGHKAMADYALPLLLPRFPLWYPYLSLTDPDSANLVPLPLLRLNRLQGDAFTEEPKDPRGYVTYTHGTVTRDMVTVAGVPGRMQKFTIPDGCAAGNSQSYMAVNSGGSDKQVPIIGGRRYRFSIRIQTTGCAEAGVGPIATIATDGAAAIGVGLNGSGAPDVVDGVWSQDFTAPEDATVCGVRWGVLNSAATTGAATVTFGQPTVTLVG